MVVSISRPELITIVGDEANQSYFGGTQDWYATDWSQRAGCGPTCASNVLAYLAFTRPSLRGLYGYDTMHKTDFSKHMEEVYRFVTPGTMGLNHVEMFSDGVANFARNRGILLEPHVFSVQSNMVRNRPHVSELMAFVKAGIASDCPLGFLNLTRGRVKNLQSWHWITITTVDMDENRIIAEASDEGHKISFDLRLWYFTTRMRGGLVYFTHGSG